MTNSSEIKNLFVGAVIGMVVAIVSNYFLVVIQSSANKDELKMQMYLQEKQSFLEACNEYLDLYRDWYELMNYYCNVDELKKDESQFISEFDSSSAKSHYIKWKKEFDRAYGGLFLVSETDFSYKTLEVSTIMHNSLKEIIIDEELSSSSKNKILKKVNDYFIENWLNVAKVELKKYNYGERLDISFEEYLIDFKSRFPDITNKDSL